MFGGQGRGLVTEHLDRTMSPPVPGAQHLQPAPVRVSASEEQGEQAEPVYWIENGQYRFRP